MEYTKGDKVVTELECGCIIFERHSVIARETRQGIHHCPKHKSAPDMYEALKEAVKVSGKYGQGIMAWYRDAEKALAKAEATDEFDFQFGQRGEHPDGDEAETITRLKHFRNPGTEEGKNVH